MNAYLLDMLESSAVGASLLLGLLGLGFAAFMPSMDRWDRRFFACFFVVLVLDIVAAFAELIVFSDPASIFCAFIAFIAPLSAVALVQMATPAFPLVTLGITISAASMFAIVAVEHFEQHERLMEHHFSLARFVFVSMVSIFG